MEKKIPIYFDSVIVASSVDKFANYGGGRLDVGVFTKYGNRNQSYITDAVSEMLIESTQGGATPVVGFFDPESKDWASHTGPLLANGYGYVDKFVGWRPLVDSDGKERDYAIFSVVLFSDYFDEAKFIVGQHQSMELDPESITGDWGVIDGQEYYIFKTAKIKGLCVIGSHEPCFSASKFFEAQGQGESQVYGQFSLLLSDLKKQVEKISNFKLGGEQPMENENLDPTVQQPEAQMDNGVQDNNPTPDPGTSTEEFEALQNKFNELQNSFNELQATYENAQARVGELEAAQESFTAQIAQLTSEKEVLQSTVNDYALKEQEIENSKKVTLIDRYAKLIGEEDVDQYRNQVNNFTFNELESKLAILFANKHMADDNEPKKVPLPAQPVDQFALLMSNYKK